MAPSSWHGETQCGQRHDKPAVCVEEMGRGGGGNLQVGASPPGAPSLTLSLAANSLAPPTLEGDVAQEAAREKLGDSCVGLQTCERLRKPDPVPYPSPFRLDH